MMVVCSTIIPTINRPTLERAVKSALGQDLDPEQHEIIVVNDSGEPLPAYDWLKSPQIKIVNTNRFKYQIRWSAIKGILVATLILASMIAPWTIRNYQAFGTFVLLNTNAGFAFYWGNHTIQGTKFMPLLSGGTQQYYDLIPDELLPLNEAELDKALLKLGVQFIVDDPGRFILLSLSRLDEYFKFWPTSDSSLISNISRVGSFGIFLPFMLYGLWTALIQNWDHRTVNEQWKIILFLLFILIYTCIHLFSWTLIRYRLPVDAILIIFAALGIAALLERNHSLREKLANYV